MDTLRALRMQPSPGSCNPPVCRRAAKPPAVCNPLGQPQRWRPRCSRHRRPAAPSLHAGAARDCLRSATRVTVAPRSRLRLEVPYELLGAVYPLLDQYGASRESEQYDEAAGVQLVVGVDAGRAAALADALADATSGRVVATAE